MSGDEPAGPLSAAARDACLNILVPRVTALHNWADRSRVTNFPWDQEMIAACEREAAHIEEAIGWLKAAAINS